MPVLFGCNDSFVAIAEDYLINIWKLENIADISKSRPIITTKLEFRIKMLKSAPRTPNTLYALDARDCLWKLRFCDEMRNELDCVKIAEGFSDPVRDIFVFADAIQVQTRVPGSKRYSITRIDRRSHARTQLGSVMLDAELDALDLDRTEILLGREWGEVRLVLPDSIEGTKLEVRSLKIPRVTAAVSLDRRHLIVARKGGQIEKVNLAAAIPSTASVGPAPLARACKVLCELLRHCRCDCSNCGGSPSDEGDSDGSGGGDNRPCDERHKAQLSWTPTRLVRAGKQVIAFAAQNRRMAVLDSRLNVIFERRIDQRSARVDTGRTHTPNLLVYKPSKGEIEAWALDTYIAKLPGRIPDGLILSRPRPVRTMTYYGQQNHRAQPNPDWKVCAFTVIEPGQNFGDPDQTGLINQLTPNVFDRVNAYYQENSFGEVNMTFDIFGHDFGGMRPPLVLPRPIASYFRDRYEAGGIQAVMPADWTNPVLFDGTETLELRANPRTGSSRDYMVPFAAFWTSRVFNSYPVDITFDGTETLQLTVEAQDGETHVLDLTFGAQAFNHDQGDDEEAFLNGLAGHVTDAIRAAESTLPDSPVTIQNIVFRRVPTEDNDAIFGRLQGQFQVADLAGDAIQKGQITFTGPGGAAPQALDDIGLVAADVVEGALGSAASASSYLRECLRATQTDAGEGPGLQEAYFRTSVSTDEDTVALTLTVTIRFTSFRGGGGATIERLDSEGLGGTGWNLAAPLPGSESSSNNQSTMRDSQDLADDTFTAALDHIRTMGPWNRENVENLFAEYDTMVVVYVSSPPSTIPANSWDADDPADFDRLRMFSRGARATDLHPPAGEDPVQMGTSNMIGHQVSDSDGMGGRRFTDNVLTHELGHSLGLPDLYSKSGYRDDVQYANAWGMMGGSSGSYHHMLGWSKWRLGWIQDGGDEEDNRVIEVPLPPAVAPETTQAWLVPVEYWDETMHTDVRDEVGGDVPIGQLMKIDLGSDGGVLSFLELRAEGAMFSQNLPQEPTIIATNGLHPDNDRWWAVNGLYRRSLHLLNTGTELRNVDDEWDFATAPEFPVKGCRAKVADIRTIRGGTIPVYRIKVDREQAEFVDLHFQDHVPSWKSPDIWVDWAGDNVDSNEPRIYPEGTPTDQGETVRFPNSGTEKHFVVARVHNAGNVRADDVKVRWFVCDPPGAGDDGRWIERGTLSIPEVGPGTFEIAPFEWQVDSATNDHQCMRMEIIDWSIPADIDPATGDTVALASDDVKLQNNNAQQNVFDFEALTGSPYDEITFEMQVHNDRVETEIATLIPEGLPYGSNLEISPHEWEIPSGQARIFKCTLRLKEEIIRPGCNNDSGFLLTAWRRDDEADEIWGSCYYHIRPRYRTKIDLLRGSWINGRVSVYGVVQVLSDEQTLAADAPHVVRLRLRFDDGVGERTYWRTVPVMDDGSFTLVSEPEKGGVLKAQAWFDRTDWLGSSRSNELVAQHGKLI